MDNVSNHEYPSENCFVDAYWSTINGKFYSNLACENRGKPPPIDPRVTERIDIRDQSPTPPPTPPPTRPPTRPPTDQNPPAAGISL